MKPGDMVMLKPAYHNALMSSLPQFRITRDNQEVEIMHREHVAVLVSIIEVEVGRERYDDERFILGLVVLGSIAGWISTDILKIVS